MNSKQDIPQNESHSSYINSEEVENGVRLIRLTHDAMPWRLGSITTKWQSMLSSLGSAPTKETLHELQNQGLWLAPEKSAPRVAVVCGGQGSVWPHMGRALYDTFPAARAGMDRIAASANWNVLDLLDETDLEKISCTRWQAPYLFLLGYAQAHYLESLGFKPNIYSGNSLGELIALCLSGIVSPEDGWSLFEMHSILIDELEKKANHDAGMMATYAPLNIIENILKDFPDLLVSNYNTPTQHILSGPKDTLKEAKKVLRKLKVPSIILNISMAFHHPHLRIIRQASLDRLNKLKIGVPHTPLISGVTAEPYPHDQPSICEHIADLDENAVRWVDCVRNMWNTHNIKDFVELGPNDTTSNLILEIEPKAKCINVCRKDREVESMRNAVAALFALGHVKHKSNYAIPDNLTQEQPAKSSNNAPQAPQAYCPEHVQDIIPILSAVSGIESSKLAAHMDLRHDLAMRSSRFPVVLQEIEKAFNIQINFEDLMQVATIGDLADVIAKFRSLNVDKQNSSTKITPKNELQSDVIKRSEINLCTIDFEQYTDCQTQSILNKNFFPAIILGDNQLACIWKIFLQNNANKINVNTEQITFAKDIAEAQKMFAQGHDYASIICTLDGEQDHEQLVDYALCLQKFLKSAHAQTCIIHNKINTSKTNTTTNTLGSVLFAGLSGMLLSATQEYPQIHFKTLESENDLHEEVLAQKLQSILELSSALPMHLRIQTDTIKSLQLKPVTFEAVPVGLPISSDHVIVVAGGGRGIMPKVIEGLASIGCTLVLIGKNSAPAANVIERLSSLGASCAYYSCDVCNMQSIQDIFTQIYSRWERVDGIIHGAGIIDNASIKNLNQEQFNNVLDVKVLGLENLLRAAAKYSTAYVVSISSIAAWFGNQGQSNYTLANRAMAAMLANYAKVHNIAWRCIWLPPIEATKGEEAGMAHSLSLPELLKTKQIGFINADELPLLMARELLCAEGEQIVLHRELPNTPLILNSKKASASILTGLKEDAHNYPNIYPTKLSAGTWSSLTAKRNFSIYSEPELLTQSGKMIDASHMLTSIYDVTQMHCAWLHCNGAEDITFAQPFSCDRGITREALVFSKAKEWQYNNLTSNLICETSLDVFDIATNGRKLNSTQKMSNAKILLGQKINTLNSTWQKYNKTVEDEHNIEQYILPIKNVAELNHSRYRWIAACMNALMHTATPANENYYIKSILRIHNVSILQNIDTLHVFWQKQNTANNISIDAKFCDANGDIYLILQGLQIELH